MLAMGLPEQDPASGAGGIAVGDIVKGRFLDGDWYLASVDVLHGDGTCTVSWLDGDEEDRIKALVDLRPMRFNRERQCYEEASAPEETAAPAEDRGRLAADRLAEALRLQEGEAPSACAEQAEAALALFRELGDGHGAADALRVLVAARVALPAPESTRPSEPREAALALAAAELARFKGAGDRRGEGSMLLAAARVNLAGSQGLAAQMAAQAAVVLQEAGDRALEAQAQAVVCQAQVLLGDMQAALKAGDAAMELHEGLDERSGRAEVLHWSARALRGLGRADDAVARSRRAVDCFRRTGRRQLEAAELHSIAEWCLTDGAPKKALLAAEQALAICKQDRLLEWEARALSTFCEVLAQLKQFRRAWTSVEVAQARFRQVGDKKAEAVTFEVMRRLHLAQLNVTKAMETVEEERKVRQSIGDKAGEIRLMHDLADVHLKGNNSAKAMEALRSALDMASEAEDVEEEVSALRAIHNLCIKTEAWLEAMRTAGLERELHKASGNRREEGNACMAVASAQFGLKDRAGALSAATEAQELFHEAGDTHGESRALALIARMQAARATTREALDAAEERLLVVREMGDTQLQAEAMQELALLHLNGGQGQEAERLCRDAAALQRREKRPEGEAEALLLLVQALEASATEKTAKLAATKALGAANEALAIAGKGKSKVLKGRALFWHAKMLYWNESFEDALREAEGAAVTFRKLQAEDRSDPGAPRPPVLEMKQEEAKALILCSLLHGLFGQPEKGLKLLDRAHSLATAAKDEVLAREAGEARRRLRGEEGLPMAEEVPEEVD